MTRYLVQRVLLLLLTLFLVASSLFLLVRLLPGDTIDLMLDQNGASYQGNRAALERDLGLDKPLLSQYTSWLGAMLRGDLGNSLWTKQPIAPVLRSRLGVSVQLGLQALFIALVVALPVGILAAMRRDGILDYVLRGATIIGLAVPAFWVALMMVVLPSKYFHWTPAGSFVPFSDDPLACAASLFLPAVAIGIPSGAALMRYVRTHMIEVMSQDFVRTARAKGVTERLIVRRHALRNTLIPVLTVAGIQVPTLLGGSVVIERIFSIPGIGSYMIEAIQRRDYPTVQAVNLVIASLVLISNLVIDVSYGLIDPRVRTK